MVSLHRPGNRFCCGWGVIFLTLFFQRIAWSTPALLPTAEGFRTPDAALRIEAGALAGAGPDRRAVELDDMDVTALLAVEGSELVLHPARPLAPGWHQLRLVEYTDDGEIIERGFWRFEVRRSPLWRERGAEVQAGLSLARRLSREIAPDDPQYSLEGTARLNGMADSGTWRLRGEADLVYQPRDALRSQAMTPLDATAFAATAARGPWRFAAGQQTPLSPSLIAEEGLLRRGLSAGFERPEQGTRVTAFALRSQEVVGLSEGIAPGGAADRLAGLTLTTRPLASRRDDLLLSATWLQGRDPGAVGEGIWGDPDLTASGRAFSLAADGFLWQRRLRLRGEWAGSRYDYDGTGPLSAETAQAHTLWASYTPAQPLSLGETRVNWEAGVEWRRLGSFFRSLANPAAGADRAGWRGFAAATWDGFGLRLDTGREHDNVDSLPGLPRIAIDRWNLALSWSPVQWRPPSWLGLPRLGLDVQRSGQTVARDGGGLAAGALRLTRAVTFSAGFDYERGRWSVAHTLARDEDLAQEGETVSRTSELSLGLQPREALNIDLTLQQERYDDNGDVATSNVADLSLSQQLSPRLAFQLGHTLEHQTSVWMRSRTTATQAQLQWWPREAVTVSLEGSDNRYAADVEQRDRQIFLRLDLAWSQEKSL